MKYCPRCKETKLKEDFYNNGARSDGLGSHCKICVREMNAKRMATWRVKNLDKRRKYERNYRLMHLYGITFEEKEQMVLLQGGRCALCETNNPSANGWCIDHDHKTNNVRSVLCHICNIIVGHVENGWDITIPAVDRYLEMYS